MAELTDLARRIRLGEDSELEFKRLLLAGERVKEPLRNAFADELAAFANGRDGTVVLGVDDETREVIGLPLERLDGVEKWVREICNDSVKPALYAIILKLELPDSTGKLVPLIQVDVPHSLFVHKSPGGYFRRLGSSKREMAPELLARLFQERSQTRVIRFDESTVPGSSPQDLDDDRVRQFLRPGNELDGTTLRKLRLIAEDHGGQARMTVSGVLLATQEPQRWLPHAEIQTVSYAGSRQDINYQNDARDLGGPLDVQVAEALHFVRRNSRIEATKATAREEQPQFSQRAIFEALVNAVAHRDCAMAGARIRLHMFRDRIELFVPGGLANTLTPDSMPLRQYRRNELIASLLARCPSPKSAGLGRSHLMDRRGDGVPIILEESQELSGRTPEYSVLDDSELRLVIWAAMPQERPKIAEKLP